MENPKTSEPAMGRARSSRWLVALLLAALLAASPSESRSSKRKRKSKQRSAPVAAGAPAGSCEETRAAMASACAGVDAKLLEQCSSPDCLAAMQAIADRQDECASEWPEETAKLMPMMIKACENDTPELQTERECRTPAAATRPCRTELRARAALS